MVAVPVPVVELYINGAWVNITALDLVRYADGINITRGQQDEASQVTPGSCKLTLDNTDGRFSPRNPLGVWYGQIGRNTPLRVSVVYGGTTYYRFCGEVPSWPQTWDPTGTNVTVSVEAAGVLRRLGQGSRSLRSPVYLLMALGKGGGLSSYIESVAAYWPCEDGEKATQIASGVGGSAMTFTGSPQLASYSDIVASDPLPVLASSALKGSVPAYTPDTTYGSTIAFMVNIPSGEVAGTVCQIAVTGTAATWEVYYTTASGGTIGVRAKDGTGATILDSGAAYTGINGKPWAVGVDIFDDPSISGASTNFWLLDINAGTDNVGSYGVGGYSVGSVSTVSMAPAAAFTSTAVGHIAVATSSAGFPSFADAYSGYTNDAASTRFTRLCDIVGITRTLIGTSDPSAVPVRMGPQHSGSVPDLFQEVADADGGVLFELTDQTGLGYRTRQGTQNQSAACSLDYAAYNLADVPEPQDDDLYTQNDITVTRLHGSSAQTELDMGALSVQDPPNGVGRYPDTPTINVFDDSTLPDQAGWRVHLGTVDEPRYPKLTVQLAHPSFTSNTTLQQNALSVDAGERVTVSNLPQQLPPGDISQLAIGFNERIDQFTHSISWNCRPESPWRVAVLDDTVLGHADTDGSTLASNVNSTATTLSIATTSSASPTWTTNHSDYPFDLTIGGERVTAVDIGTVITANPLFLQGLTGWAGSNSSAAISATHQYISGSSGVLVTPNGTSASGGLNGALSGVGTVTPAATYTISCWCYASTSWTDVRTCVDWYDASGTFLSSSLGSATSIATTTWTFLSQSLTAPASASQAVTRFRWGSTPSASLQFWVYALRAVADASVGSSSPQSFTVVRSVNGIAKSQTAGTAVSLYQPMILSF